MSAIILGLILGAIIIFLINKDAPKYQRNDEQREIAKREVAKKIYEFIIDREKEIFLNEPYGSYYESANEVSLLIEISRTEGYFYIKMLNTLALYTDGEYYWYMDEEEFKEAEIEILELKNYFQKYL